MKKFSKGQCVILGITFSLIVTILFCLSTKSFQGVDASGYKLVQNYAQQDIGNATYTLVRQAYNPDTEYAELTFVRKSENVEVYPPKISGTFQIYRGAELPVQTKTIQSDYIVFQIKSCPSNFELGKLVIQERAKDIGMNGGARTNAESDGIYFSKKNLELNPKLKAQKSSFYEKESMNIRIHLIDRKLDKYRKNIQELEKENSKLTVYQKELVQEKESLVGKDKDSTEEKIQAITSQIETIKVELSQKQKEAETLEKQKAAYKKQYKTKF